MGATRLRFVQLLTGGLIIVFLGVHMVVTHLNNILRFFGAKTIDPTTFDSMIARSRQGTWAGIYIVLLALALYHGLYGLRDILMEANPPARAERAITGFLIAFGVIFFVGGTITVVALLSR